MTSVLLTTRLKVADPTALTALATLRDRLGLAGQLARLSREELFLFEISDRPAGARRLVEELARQTNLFLNPNKHTFRLAASDEPAGPAAESPAGAPPEAWLLVWTPGDGDGLGDSLERHTGARAVRRIRRAWLWRLTAETGVSPAAFSDVVARAGVVESRHRGFLAHPAFEECRLYGSRPTVYDIDSALLKPVESVADE